MVAHRTVSLKRSPYTGSHLALVVGIDVGMTFSGVSFAFLYPGKIPEVWPVNRCAIHPLTLRCISPVSLSLLRHRYADQTIGHAKVPSVLYYNDKGDMVAAGAVTATQKFQRKADMEDWTKVEQ